jgi:proline iminopeptidase
MAAPELYPDIQPFATGELALDAPHVMMWEQSGRADGMPVLFLHGGPGAGANASNRRFFDPAHYRIVVYDQRGSGRSRPLGSLNDNTTGHLVADIESLRQHLGIARWLVFGGSWGATLALAYAQAHPERCLALILRGIFLCRPSEVDWFLRGMGAFFPEHWQAFAGHLPAGERGDLLAGYYRRLTDPDPAVHLPAAHAWSRWEGACSTFKPNPGVVADFDRDEVALGLARIEAHYFVNEIFLAPDALLAGIETMRHIPGFIVQGRYDMVCPIRTALDLARAWPEAELTVVPEAGHSSLEPGIRQALVTITNRLRDRGLGGKKK